MSDGAFFSQQARVLFALPEEAAPFVRLWRAQGGSLSVLPADPAQATESVVVAVSGVGARKAAESAALLLAAPRASCLLIAGFCGGLHPDLAPGSLVLAERVLHRPAGDSSLPPQEEALPSAEWLRRAQSVRLPEAAIASGALVTTDRVLVTRAEKEAFAGNAGYLAVDMETLGAARAAEERGIPWLAVRAVTDDFRDDLPLDFNALAGADGSVDRQRIVRAVLRQPQKIPALLRLGSRSALAAKNLARFLTALLRTLPETAP